MVRVCQVPRLARPCTIQVVWNICSQYLGGRGPMLTEVGSEILVLAVLPSAQILGRRGATALKAWACD